MVAFTSESLYFVFVCTSELKTNTEWYAHALCTCRVLELNTRESMIASERQTLHLRGVSAQEMFVW